MAAAYGLGPDDMIVERQPLEDLQSALYCLQAAVEDVERDLQQADDLDAVRTALHWLLENARPLADTWIEPRSAEG